MRSRGITIVAMPRISFFYGIAIWMYAKESHHQTAHFHAVYAEDAASIAIANGRVLAGALPRRALASVQKWAALHEEELLANWDRARRGEAVESIEPLA